MNAVVGTACFSGSGSVGSGEAGRDRRERAVAEPAAVRMQRVPGPVFSVGESGMPQCSAAACRNEPAALRAELAQFRPAVGNARAAAGALRAFPGQARLVAAERWTGASARRVTCDQSASSSSARIIGSEVLTPCPISGRGAPMTVLPSASMRTKSPMAGAASAEEGEPAARARRGPM